MGGAFVVFICEKPICEMDGLALQLCGTCCRLLVDVERHKTLMTAQRLSFLRPFPVHRFSEHFSPLTCCYRVFILSLWNRKNTNMWQPFVFFPISMFTGKRLLWTNNLIMFNLCFLLAEQIIFRIHEGNNFQSYVVFKLMVKYVVSNRPYLKCINRYWLEGPCFKYLAL